MDNRLEYVSFTPKVTPKSVELVEKLGVVIAPEVQNFHKSIPNYKETALYSLEQLAKVLKVKKLYVKDESTRFGLNAFKALGASYAMGTLLGEKLGLAQINYADLITDEAREKLGEQNFIAVTDGNHGRGVAWFAKLLGYKAKIYMPQGTVQDRIANIEQEGAEVIVHDGNYDDAIRFVSAKAKEDGWMMIQDTAWEGYESIPLDIMRGYTTMAKEIMEQLEAFHDMPTHIFLQAGVGSMAAATVAYVVDYYTAKGLDLPIITVVEPKVANCLFESAKNEKRSCVGGAMASMMAGLCCGEPCTLAWDILQSYVKCFVMIEDELDMEGMRRLAKPLLDDPVIISGESGAAGFSVALAALSNPEYKALKELLQLGSEASILCISTEGATDKVNYNKIVG